MHYPPRRERTYVFPTVGGARGLALRGFSEAEALAAHVAGGGGFAEIDLSGRCLRGMDLRDVDFRGARLRNADLRGCDVGYARFGGADLSGADLAGIYGHGPSFEDCVLERHAGKPTAFDGADIPGASFARARAVGASFSKADMERADLSDLTAEGCEFRGTRLGDAEHARARYDRCDFAKADLRSLSQRNRRGVTRVNRTVGTEAFRNAYDGAMLDDVVPAFASDRRMSAVSKGLAFGLAGLAVAGALAGGEHLLPHAAEALRRAAESAGLAERLEALTHYRHLADLLASTAPGRWAADHAGTLVTVAVSGALLLKEKAGDHVKEHLSGRVRSVVDRALPLVAEVARRVGNVRDVVAAFTRDPMSAGLLAKGLTATDAGDARGFFRTACLGDTHVVVCTGGRLNEAMEWLATGLGRSERNDHDVLLVRDRPGSGGEPAALRLNAGGGMTAFWRGPGGVRTRTWSASEMAEDPGSPWVNARLREGPDVVRRGFLNAVLRDHLRGLDFDYVEGASGVEFGDAGRVKVTAPAKGGGVVAYEGVVDDPDGGTVFRP